MLSWLCIFHLAVCTTQGIKALSENNVTGLSHWCLVTPCHSFLISFSIFLHSPTSSILKISLDSAEAGPWHTVSLIRVVNCYVFLLFIFLMISDFEHFLICLLAIYKSSLEKSSSSMNTFNLVIDLFNCRNYLYILLVEIRFFNILGLPSWLCGKRICREPAWGIPSVTRSCGKSSDGKANQSSGFPPGISWASTPPKNKNLPAFPLFWYSLEKVKSRL